MKPYPNFDDTEASGLDEARQALIDATLNLLFVSGATSFMVPIPNTTPTLWVSCRERQAATVAEEGTPPLFFYKWRGPSDTTSVQNEPDVS